MQITGASFASLGVAFIVANKVEYNHTLIPQTIHSIFGILCISFITLQVFIGMQKLEYLEWSNTKIRRWHNDAGYLLWDLLCVTIVFGILEFLEWTFFNLFIVIGSVVITWLSVHAQLQCKRNAEEIQKECMGAELGHMKSDALEEDDIEDDEIMRSGFT